MSETRDPKNRRTRRTILVTGFEAFPGMPRNPTQHVITALKPFRPRFDRLGVSLQFLLLPVRFDKVEADVAEAVMRQRPDAILHLGVASRRRHVSIEVRGINRAGTLHPDASRAQPRQILAPGSPQIARATYPAQRILAALRASGTDARLSINAGDYVCNATLYRSLLAGFATEIGFLHLPRTRKSWQPRTRRRTFELTHNDLLSIVIETLLVMCKSTINGTKATSSYEAIPS